jgi:hypothetical protein
LDLSEHFCFVFFFVLLFFKKILHFNFLNILSDAVALDAKMKLTIRNATLSGDSFQNLFPIVDTIYQMHRVAYHTCCCSGAVAPYFTWV